MKWIKPTRHQPGFAFNEQTKNLNGMQGYKSDIFGQSKCL